MGRSRGGLTSKVPTWLTAALARRLKTSCSWLDRMLAPANDQVSLASLVITAHAVRQTCSTRIGKGGLICRLWCTGARHGMSVANRANNGVGI
jgi:hypothetical protein